MDPQKLSAPPSWATTMAESLAIEISTFGNKPASAFVQRHHGDLGERPYDREGRASHASVPGNRRVGATSSM